MDFLPGDTNDSGDVYEITWLMPNGDWQYQRHTGLTFQGACRLGLWGAGDCKTRKLIRIEKVAQRAGPVFPL